MVRRRLAVDYRGTAPGSPKPKITGRASTIQKSPHILMRYLPQIPCRCLDLHPSRSLQKNAACRILPDRARHYHRAQRAIPLATIVETVPAAVTKAHFSRPPGSHSESEHTKNLSRCSTLWSALFLSTENGHAKGVAYSTPQQGREYERFSKVCACRFLRRKPRTSCFTSKSRHCLPASPTPRHARQNLLIIFMQPMATRYPKACRPIPCL